MSLADIDTLLDNSVEEIYMIRYLDADGASLYQDDPIIIRTSASSLCIMGKSERLIMSSEWKDPFADSYVMSNPVYPKDIVQMRREIGGYYIFNVTESERFHVYIGQKLKGYNLIRDANEQIVGIVLNFGDHSLTFLVTGEECMINPVALPEEFKVIGIDTQRDSRSFS